MARYHEPLPPSPDVRLASRTGWILPAVVAAALLITYSPVISGVIDQWLTDEDMSQGFLVPIAVAWIVWRERARWLVLTPRPDLRGIALLALGTTMHLASAVGAGLFVGALALLVSIAGAVLALGGTAYLRAWAWPLTLTIFMLPKLAVAYNEVTLPLQLAATRLAAGALRLFHVAVIMNGNILEAANYRVAVEEACNGIRFLLSLGFLAVMFAYFTDRKPWMRVALLIATVPLAVGANALRIASAVLLGSVNPALGEGLFHTVSGALVFLVCVPVLAILRILINRIHARFAA